MAKGYTKHGAATDLASWERDFRERWTAKANAKNDRIIGKGYAERQIADTLSKVKPIDVNVTRIGKNMKSLIVRGDAVDTLAELFPENYRSMRELFAEILDTVPEVKPKRGHWVRDVEAALNAPGLRKLYCSECYTYNDTRSPYCPNCGAAMRGKR